MGHLRQFNSITDSYFYPIDIDFDRKKTSNKMSIMVPFVRKKILGSTASITRNTPQTNTVPILRGRRQTISNRRLYFSENGK